FPGYPMYQIDVSSAASVHAAATPMGTAAFFTDGNPAGGIPATIVPAEWLNAVMLEILNAIEAAGITPNKASYNQLTQAIQTLGRNYEQINIAGSSSTTLTSTQAGVFLVSLIGALTADETVVVPNSPGAWVFQNSTTGGHAVTIQTAAGTGVKIPAGGVNSLWCDGINVYPYQSVLAQYIADTGAANAYAVALTPAATALVDGMAVQFRAVHANAGAATLAVNSLPAQPIHVNNGTALRGGEIVSGGFYTAVWSAALNAWQLVVRSAGLNNYAVPMNRLSFFSHF
ncbi:MAG: hypothetical protein ACRETW_03685, partial [Stenotrophobium sp.]